MKKIICVVFLLCLFGCSQNSFIINGKTYCSSGGFSTECIHFINDTQFYYFLALDDVGQGTFGAGTYEIGNGKLKLNFGYNRDDNQYDYISIDSSESNNDNVIWDITCLNSFSKNCKNTVAFSCIDSHNKKIINDSCNMNDNVKINLKKSKEMISLKKSFWKYPELNQNIISQIYLNASYNYKISIIFVNTALSNSNDGKTIFYKIKQIDKYSYEIIHETGRPEVFKIDSDF